MLDAEREKLRGHLGADDVHADVVRARSAEAVAIEARHRLEATWLERLPEHVFRNLGHRREPTGTRPGARVPAGGECDAPVLLASQRGLAAGACRACSQAPGVNG